MTHKKIRVKPTDGLQILDNRGKVISPRGAEVDKTVEILRHIREGALVVVKTIQKKEEKGGK